MIKKLKNIIYNYYNDIKKMATIQKTIYFTIIILYTYLLIRFNIYTLLITLILLIIFYIWARYNNNNFIKQCSGNGVIFGGRGKGKGLLLNKKINSDGFHFCNVPYNDKTILINIKEYIDSIQPNTSHNFITNSVQQIKKIDKFEGKNIYWDDVGVYAPNFMDNELKKYYPSLSCLLPINRHLYNAYMIISVQDLKRPYKILRELQTDFAIKAIKTIGTKNSIIWNSIPILRKLIITKYIYYENIDTAEKGLLPFNAKTVLTELSKHGYLTSGQALKEQYEATYGQIRYGFVIQRKSKVNYDTRYFHQIVFGEKAPN